MKRGKRYVQLVVLAFIAGIGSWSIAHYEDLVPRRWEEVRPSGDEFSVDLPGKAKIQDRQVPSGEGRVATLHVISTVTRDGTYYGCAYIDDPNFEQMSTDEVLTSVQNETVHNVDGILVSQKQATIGGYPAREIQARARGGSFLDSRLIAVRKRMYMLSVITTAPQNRNSRDINRFFDSFKTIGK